MQHCYLLVQFVAEREVKAPLCEVKREQHRLKVTWSRLFHWIFHWIHTLSRESILSIKSSKIVSNTFYFVNHDGFDLHIKQTNVNNTPKTNTYATLLPPCTILAEREVEGQLCEVKREQDRLKVIWSRHNDGRHRGPGGWPARGTWKRVLPSDSVEIHFA